MDRCRIRTVLFALLMPWMMVLGGCASMGTPEQQYQQASTLYTTTVLAYTIASQSGNISREALESFNQGRILARALLDEWGEAIAGGAEFDGLAVLNRVLEAMIEMQLEAQEGRSNDGNTGSVGDRESVHRLDRWYFRIAGSSPAREPRLDGSRTRDHPIAA